MFGMTVILDIYSGQYDNYEGRVVQEICIKGTRVAREFTVLEHQDRVVQMTGVILISFRRIGVSRDTRD